MSVIAPSSTPDHGAGGQSVDVTLDLRGTPCPINFVRTKLQLQKMAPGEWLEVWIDPGEPTEQVPDSLAVAGFPVEELVDQGDYVALRVCKPDDDAQ